MQLSLTSISTVIIYTSQYNLTSITMDKRKTDEKSSGVKKRKVLTIDNKLEVIKRYEHGDSKAKIGRDLRMNESTVRAILKKIDDYKEKGKVASTSGTQTTRNRSKIMIEMEHLLSLWIEDCNEKQIPLSTTTIKMKALDIFATIKENLTKENEIPSGTEETFTASSGWFDRFKTRTGIYNVRIKGEAASADRHAAGKNPNVLQKIIEDWSSDNRQIFNIDETGLFWIKMPSKTFLLKKENSQPELGFDEIDDTDDVPQSIGLNKDERLEPQSVGLSNDELLNLDQQHAYKKADNREVRNEQQMKEISGHDFDTMFREFEKFKQLIMHIDPNIERSTQVQRNLDKVLCCYTQICAEKKKETDKYAVQMTLDKYFSNK